MAESDHFWHFLSTRSNFSIRYSFGISFQFNSIVAGSTRLAGYLMRVSRTMIHQASRVSALDLSIQGGPFSLISRQAHRVPVTGYRIFVLLSRSTTYSSTAPRVRGSILPSFRFVFSLFSLFLLPHGSGFTRPYDHSAASQVTGSRDSTEKKRREEV